jgi:uncharacterized protein
MRLAPGVLVVTLALVLVAGCGDGDSSASCEELTPLDGFDEVAVSIDGESQRLLLAQDDEQRARGLMEVTDLEGYPGMLFVYPGESSGSFWMRNTPTPLSIAFLDPDGRIVSTTDMEPCVDEPECPLYAADGPFLAAVEVPQGELDDLGLTGDARLEIEDEIDPS